MGTAAAIAGGKGTPVEKLERIYASHITAISGVPRNPPVRFFGSAHRQSTVVQGNGRPDEKLHGNTRRHHLRRHRGGKPARKPLSPGNRRHAARNDPVHGASSLTRSWLLRSRGGCRETLEQFPGRHFTGADMTAVQSIAKYAKYWIWILAAGAAFAVLKLTLLSPPAVRLVTVTNRDLAAQVYGNGTVEAKVVVDVSSKITGRIVELFADQGDHVRRGQLLAKLESDDFGQQAIQAEALVRNGIGNASGRGSQPPARPVRTWSWRNATPPGSRCSSTGTSSPRIEVGPVRKRLTGGQDEVAAQPVRGRCRPRGTGTASTGRTSASPGSRSVRYPRLRAAGRGHPFRELEQGAIVSTQASRSSPGGSTEHLGKGQRGRVPSARDRRRPEVPLILLRSVPKGTVFPGPGRPPRP